MYLLPVGYVDWVKQSDTSTVAMEPIIPRLLYIVLGSLMVYTNVIASASM